MELNQEHSTVFTAVTSALTHQIYSGQQWIHGPGPRGSPFKEVPVPLWLSSFSCSTTEFNSSSRMLQR